MVMVSAVPTLVEIGLSGVGLVFNTACLQLCHMAFRCSPHLRSTDVHVVKTYLERLSSLPKLKPR
jgi:hypothetical protein